MPLPKANAVLRSRGAILVAAAIALAIGFGGEAAAQPRYDDAFGTPASRPSPRTTGDGDATGSDSSPVAQGSRPQPESQRTIRRPDDTESRSGRTASSPWTTLLASLFVIGLIVVLGRLWRKHAPALPGGLPTEAVDVLGSRSLNGRQALHVVRIGGRILVVGSSAEGLRTLTELGDPVEVDYVAGLCRRSNRETSFGETLSSWFGGSSQPPGREGDIGSPAAGSDVPRPTEGPGGSAEHDLRERLSRRLGLSASNRATSTEAADG